ncbi:phosphoribosylglycinamide formyltransferase [Candidatus Micrarchaeota archaeon CG10_big_fil_rev_8_21_14_0_10_45_29]|nr:MAG: phosphoribosylglycinamide formyltransferase [Candidatus Micrarchaeota archaeon CG10_big_fil_rev_8_21_14_0_10_45_29]
MELPIVILASGRGSNFEAIANAIKEKRCDAKILALISDNPGAKALEIAKKQEIPSHVFERKNFSSSEEFDDALFSAVEEYSPQLIVLAGYMRIIRSKKVFEKYKNKIINIHPSLLPKYPGAHAQKDAFDAGEKESGLTIHIVDESLDGGPIIYQEKINISDCKSAAGVSEKILKREHMAYPAVIDKISKGIIKLE